jgi:hypothetical protein
MKPDVQVGVIKFYPHENPSIKYDKIEGMCFFSIGRIYHLFIFIDRCCFQVGCVCMLLLLGGRSD